MTGDQKDTISLWALGISIVAGVAACVVSWRVIGSLGLMVGLAIPAITAEVVSHWRNRR